VFAALTIASPSNFVISPLVLEHYSDDDEKKAFEAITIENVWDVINKRWNEIKS